MLLFASVTLSCFGTLSFFLCSLLALVGYSVPLHRPNLTHINSHSLEQIQTTNTRILSSPFTPDREDLASLCALRLAGTSFFQLGSRVEGRDEEKGGSGAGKFKSQTGYQTLPADASVVGLESFLVT